MDLNLTLAEIVTLLKKEGWHVPLSIDGVFIGNTVRVCVIHLMYSFVQIERIGLDEFKFTPFIYKDKT